MTTVRQALTLDAGEAGVRGQASPDQDQDRASQRVIRRACGTGWSAGGIVRGSQVPRGWLEDAREPVTDPAAQRVLQLGSYGGLIRAVQQVGLIVPVPKGQLVRSPVIRMLPHLPTRIQPAKRCAALSILF